MSALLGERDRLIMNTVPRYFVSVVEKALLLQASTPVFAVSRAGAATPATITITAELVSITGTVTFTVSPGATLSVSGKVATLQFADMGVDVAFVQAKVLDAESGVEFLRSVVVSKVVDGANGAPGADGATYYTWVKYGDSATGAGLSDSPVGKTFIGLAYNKITPAEGIDPADYTWSLIKGTDGVPGAPGADGLTTYTWIKYADLPDGTGLYDVPTATTLYLGLATNKNTAVESGDKADYVWSKFRGDQGVPGAPGAAATTYYTWVKYGDSAVGAGLSDNPAGKSYIGLAYNKITPVEGVDPTDYTWSLIKGVDGQPGGKGADGQTLYTWIKYSDYPDGQNPYDTPNASTMYLGLSTNRTTPVESPYREDYVWSKFRGDQGVPGTAAPALYTWVKYGDSATGAGLSDSPVGKTFIGLAYNKITPVEGIDPADYSWSLIKGTDGVPGAPGADGQTLYTWIKYSDYPDGVNPYDVPTASTMYLGLSTNRTTPAESPYREDYVWSKFRGDQGVPGVPGTAAPTFYTWVKYADTASGAGLSDDPAGKAWIGLAYNKATPVESTAAGDYAWSLIKGADGVPGSDGTDGLPGVKGADGQTFYTWIKYSDYPDGQNPYDTPNASTMYLGLSTNRTTPAESPYREDYVWSKFRGDQGVPGTAAPALYTWVKYGDSAAGAGLTDSPVGKAFIGLAYNKTTTMESTAPGDYAWSLIKGTDGVPGAPGADGLTPYTWIKYADLPDGTGLYDLPTANTLYLGLSVNRTTSTESTNKSDYVWSKFRGDQGVPGTTGPQGQRGTKTVVAGGYSTWSDASAVAELAAAGFGAPINRDVVTLYGPIVSAPTFTMTKFFDGSSWVLMGAHIDGGLLVSGTVAAQALAVDRLSAISSDLGQVTAGDIHGASVRGGEFTGYAWPGSGTGFYLGPEGLLMGNALTGGYVEMRADGTIFMPGFSVVNGVAKFGGELSAATGTFAGNLSAASGTLGTITAGYLQNAANTTYVNLNATGDQTFLYAGSGKIRLNADGSGVFARSIVSEPNVVRFGKMPLSVGWRDNTMPFTVYVDTGETFSELWYEAPSATYIGNATLAGGLADSGGLSGYVETTVVVGGGLYTSAQTPVGQRIYLRVTWTPGSGTGRINPASIAWKLVKV